MVLTVETNPFGHGSKTNGTILGFSVHHPFQSPILRTYFSGWIGMFTGGTIWLLTHGQILNNTYF